MTTLRKQIKKWFYGSCPFFSGSFPYFGTRVYFPSRSHIFNLACEQTVYEPLNLQLISTLLKSDTVYFDVGANIGLLSAPLLNSHPSCKVVSIEPSPNALPFLMRTYESSKFKDRWCIIGKALGKSIGSLDFFIASADLGAFDGLKDSGRAGETRKITVPVTTLDAEWEAMGKPPVSVVKIDVEGAEIHTLEGAISCISSEKPYILLEWNLMNLRANDCSVCSLLEFAKKINYKVFSILEQPTTSHRYFLNIDFVPITDCVTLQIQMLSTENFLLVSNS